LHLCASAGVSVQELPVKILDIAVGELMAALKP